MFTEFCAFLEDLYGGTHYLQETKFGSILYIRNGLDRFKINLTDKADSVNILSSIKVIEKPRMAV